MTGPGPKADVERLAGWVRDHGPSVHGYLFALVRDRHTADDLLQDVFCRAWEARHRYVESGSQRAYLLRIADRLACDCARRGRGPFGKREVLLDGEAWRTIEPFHDAQPDDDVLAVESRQQLARALEALSEPQRRTLLLRYFGDLDFVAIARILGCPLNTVLSHGRRGLLALRRMLVEEPKIEEPKNPLPVRERAG